MRIFRFEICKLFDKKTVVTLFALMLLNSVLFYNQYYKVIMPEEVQQQAQLINDFLAETFSKGNTSTQSNASILEKAQQMQSDFLLVGQFLRDGYVELPQEQLEKLLQKYQKIYEENKNGIYGDALSQIIKQYEPAVKYPLFLENLQKQARQASSISIFSNQNSFSYRNSMKTASDFAHLQGTAMQPTNETALYALSNFYFSDFLVLLLTCLLCMRLFDRDRTYGMDALITATVHGRRYLRFMQTLAVIVISTLVAICLYAMNFLLADIMFGIPSLSIAVQSMNLFRNTVFSWNVLQYLLMFLAAKVMACVVAASLIVALSLLLENRVAIWLIFGSFYGVGFLCWMYLPQEPIAKIVRYLNPFGLFDAFEIYGTYQNLNLFGYPFALWKCSVVLVAILVTSLLLICVFGKEFIHITLRRISLPFPHHQRRGCQSEHIFVQECYRFFWMHKIIFLYAFVLVFGFLQVSFLPEKLTISQSIYSGYIEQYRGGVEEQDKQEIEGLAQTFDSLSQSNYELGQRRANGEISDMEYSKQYRKNAYLSMQQDGFSKFYKQYIYVSDLTASGGKGELIHWLHMQTRLFAGSKNGFTCILFFVSLLIALSGQYEEERRYGLAQLVRATEKGWSWYFYIKLLIGAFSGALMMLTVIFPRQIEMFWRFGMEDFSASIQSVFEFSKFPFTISIESYLLLAFLLQILLGAISGVLLSCVCCVIKNQFMTCVIGFLIFVVPPILLYFTHYISSELSAQLGSNLLFVLKPFQGMTDIHTLLSKGSISAILFWPISAFLLIIPARHRYRRI